MTQTPRTQDLPTRRRPLQEWWPEFNRALALNGFPEAGFGIARSYWADGCTVEQAVAREVAVLSRMQAA